MLKDFPRKCQRTFPASVRAPLLQLLQFLTLIKLIKLITINKWKYF